MNRVLLVDNQPLVLEGIDRVLTRAGDFEVVGCCRCGADALKTAAETRPDVIVLNVRLGDMSGVELCRRLMGAAPLCAIVLLTTYDDVDAIHQCLENGASGVLLKSTESLDLVRALRLVATGELVIDPLLIDRLRLIDLRPLDSGSDAIQLRPREAQVLRLMATGAGTEAIADELGLTVNTVRTYIQTMMEKMGVHSRVQAVVTAQRRGLI